MARHFIKTSTFLLVLAAVVVTIGYLSIRVPPLIFFGAFAICFLGFFILKEPFLGILLVAFFLPFERLGAYELAGLTIRPSQVTAVLTIGSLLLSRLGRRSLWLPPLPILLPLGIFFVSSLFGLLNAPNLERSSEVLIFIVFTIAIGLLVPFLLKTPEQLRRLLRFLFAAFFVVSLFGLYQFAGDLVGLPQELTGLRDLYTKEVLGFPRVQSTALEPLYFANYLLVPLGLLLSLFFARDRSIPPLVAFFWIGIGSVNLILTVARGGYIAFAVVVLLLLSIHLVRLFTFRNLWYGVLGLLIVGFFSVQFIGIQKLSEGFLEHVTNIFGGASYVERLEMFEIAKRAWQSHPWVGIGAGSFGPYASVHPYIVPEHGWRIVNNEYLELLAEHGVIGFASMMIVFAVLIVRSVKALCVKGDRYIKAVLAGLLASFVGILVQYNTFSILYIVHIWFTIGLLIAVQNMILKRQRA